MTEEDKIKIPLIAGAKGKGARTPTIAPNSLFSTDVLFTLLSLPRPHPPGSQTPDP